MLKLFDPLLDELSGAEIDLTPGRYGLLTACDGPVVILPEAELEMDISEVQVANELRTDISAEMVEPYLCESIRSLAALHRAPKPASSSIPAMRD